MVPQVTTAPLLREEASLQGSQASSLQHDRGGLIDVDSPGASGRAFDLQTTRGISWATNHSVFNVRGPAEWARSLGVSCPLESWQSVPDQSIVNGGNLGNVGRDYIRKCGSDHWLRGYWGGFLPNPENTIQNIYTNEGDGGFLWTLSEEPTLNGRLIVEVKTIADWLSLNSWYEYHQEMTERRAGDTGIWFLQSDEFQLWQREGNARLWMTGMRECSSIFSHLHC